MTNKQEWIKELTEKLADIEHQRWTSWYEYQRDATTPEAIARWNRQAETSYKDLSEEDKEKDREQVYKYLPLISDLLKEEEKRIKGVCKKQCLINESLAYSEGYKHGKNSLTK